MLKKITVFALLFVLLAQLTAFGANAQEVQQEDPEQNGQEPGLSFELEAEGAVLMDAASGKVLVAKNCHERFYPASITKVMTVLLAMEGIEAGRVSLEDEVMVSENAESMGGSQIFLSAGDVVSLENLLVGVVVGSGNDASVAVAEHCYGSLESFVEKMNEKALELGMENTHFLNPHGLHEEGHYTTPHDVAIMSRELLLRYPQIHQWLTIWMDENFLEGQIKSGKVYLSNSNKLVRYYQGADGLKTGYTQEAGHCIAATARRGTTRYVAVVMYAPTSDIRFTEARKLMDYGFANFESLPVAVAGEEIAKVRVEKGKDVMVAVTVEEDFAILREKGVEPEIRKEVEIQETILAPLEAGEALGFLHVYVDEELAGSTPLTAHHEIPRAGVVDLLSRIVASWLKFGR